MQDFFQDTDARIAKIFDELVTHGKASVAASDQLTREDIETPLHFPEEETIMHAMMVSDQSEEDLGEFRWGVVDELEDAGKGTSLRLEYLHFKSFTYCFRRRTLALARESRWDDRYGGGGESNFWPLGPVASFGGILSS
eukprot:s4582_g3.t1